MEVTLVVRQQQELVVSDRVTNCPEAEPYNLFPSGGKRRKPLPTYNTKYGTKGGFHTRVFANVRGPPQLVFALADALNHAVANNTWRSYQTAANHVTRISKELGITLVFPFSLEDTLTYLGYLISVRKVSGSTLEKYMSGLRMAHLTRGHFSPWIRPDVVKMMITGIQNKEQVRKRMEGKKGRLPITPLMLRSLRSKLIAAKMRTTKKRLIWLVAAWCWSGAFRIHEILARDSMTFDPTSTLLSRDVSLTTAEVAGVQYEVVKVFLRHPKEQRLSSGVTIDLFEVKGDAGWLCPVKAFRKWKEGSPVKPSTNLPLLRLTLGESYTGTAFNTDLKRFLGDMAGDMKGSVTSHSFRSGIATSMSQAGYGDEEIMAMGRWRSDAFLRYVKAPREKRALVAQELASRMARMAICN